jgi:sucrose phosphorylase
MTSDRSIDFPARARDLLDSVYGPRTGGEVLPQVLALIERYTGSRSSDRSAELTQRDAILIVYPDQVQQEGTPPLRCLAEFCEAHLADLISGVHILPFFPSSSDDGFSVIDYREVDPSLGTWQDVGRLGQSFRLMFDAVVNHVSAESAWFRGFLNNEPRYQDYFLAVAEDTDLSAVARPRTSPLLTRFETAGGPKAVWTTFSPDQVDVNYGNPRALLEILDVILFYVAQGADLIRLDAAGYLWKEAGTSCLHLPHTHHIVQLFRAILRKVAPHVLLVTETNVPHEDNVSYLGDGRNEAHLVYNFSLPPLVLDAFYRGKADRLTEWTRNLSLPSTQVAFLNFLASHDGIGLNPVRGILREAEIEALVGEIRRRGGLVSSRRNQDGSSSPYELNVNFLDALSEEAGSGRADVQIDGFMTAQAMMLALAGIPAIYFHSLFGSRGWKDGVAQTGRNRSINRQKMTRRALEQELADPRSLRSKVFQRYERLLTARAASVALHPQSPQQVLSLCDELFALRRGGEDQPGAILCLHNVSGRPVSARLPAEALPGGSAQPTIDVITGERVSLAEHRSVELAPYQSLWLTRGPVSPPAMGDAEAPRRRHERV